MIARLFTQFLLAVALLTSSTVASARFIQVDPAPVEPNNIHSFNRYAYGNNNPYKYVDPDGRHPLLIFAAVGAATPAIANFGMRMAPYAQRGVAEAMTLVQRAASHPATLHAIELVEGLATGGPTSGVASGAAASSMAGKLLHSELVASEIASGHAFAKHVVQQGEFKALGISSRSQFEKHIEHVMNNPTATKSLSNGRSAVWHDAAGTVVIRNPKAADGGTAFQPSSGKAYFDNLQ